MLLAYNFWGMGYVIAAMAMSVGGQRKKPGRRQWLVHPARLYAMRLPPLVKVRFSGSCGSILACNVSEEGMQRRGDGGRVGMKD